MIYVVYIIAILLSMIGGFWRPIFSVLNPWVLAALDMIVYLFLGAQMILDRREFFVLAVFWTIFGVALATFAPSYRNATPNLLSFLIVFFSTYYHVTVTKPVRAVSKSLGLLAGILALVQGIYVALATVFTYIIHFGGWIIPVPPLSQAFLAPPLTVAAITVVIYMLSGVGMIKERREFFLLVILWTLLESALAVADSSFMRSHINVVSILILAFGTYYLAK